jgi:hypothetical protein
MSTAQLAENIPIIEHQDIAPADGTTQKDIGGRIPFYRRIDTVLCLSDDSASNSFALYINDGLNYHLIGEFSVPAHAGESGNPLFDVLSNLFPAVQSGIALPVNNFLAVKALVTVGADVSFHAIGGAF